jgi:hypothetical protein
MKLSAPDASQASRGDRQCGVPHESFERIRVLVLRPGEDDILPSLDYCGVLREFEDGCFTVRRKLWSWRRYRR